MLSAFMKKSNYTDPELRERLKNKILNSEKGGNSGEWSARKAQLLANAYKKSGGGYKQGLSKKQQNLKKWAKEEWMTRSQYETGSPDKAITENTTKRYLPKKAWGNLNPNERASTDLKKRTKSKDGQQFVPNTLKAKKASKKARQKM